MPKVCLRHPDRHAVTSCAHCAKPLCSDCVLRRGRLVFCSTACIGEYARGKGLPAGNRTDSGAGTLRKVLALVLLLGGIIGAIAVLL